MTHSELLADLVPRLRAADFQIAPDDYLRAVHVAAQAEELPAERLGSLLGPLFADTRQQQERFAEIFKELIAPRVVEPAPPPAPPRRKSYLMAAFLFTLAMFAVAAIAWRLSHPPIKSPPPPQPPPTTAEPGFHVAARHIVEMIAGRELNPTYLALAAVAALLLALSVLMLIRALRQDRERAPEAGPPYAWRLKPGGHPVLFSADDLGRLSRALRGKTESESLRLDLRRTIDGAVRNPAAAELVYSAALKTPEYIVLIEKRSERDHHAAFFDQLTTLLAADGVDVQRFYFGYDPRVCWSTSSRVRTTLADLHRRSADARLILFGSPPALFDPINGTVDARVLKELRWPMQAIVSADAATHTVPSIHSASGNDALISLGEYFSGGYRPKKKGPREPLLAAVHDARRAKQCLSPAAWRWLLACAAYPRLQWELTTALGMAICGAELPRAIRELIALPWFRDGEIPDRERYALVETLQQDKALEQLARTVILDILGKTSLPEGSFASREKTLQVITQEVWLNRDDQPRLRSHLARLRQYRIAEIGRDSSLLRLLLTAPGSRVASRVPHMLRRLWYHSGIPAMGRREIRGLPVAACVMAAFIALSVNFGPADWMMRDSASLVQRSRIVWERVPDAPVTITGTASIDMTGTAAVSTSTSGTFASSTTYPTDTVSTDTGTTDTVSTSTSVNTDTAGTGTVSFSTDASGTFVTGDTSATTGTAPPECVDRIGPVSATHLMVTLCKPFKIRRGEAVTLSSGKKQAQALITRVTPLGSGTAIELLTKEAYSPDDERVVMKTTYGTSDLTWEWGQAQRSWTIQFDFGSTTLNPAAQRMLLQVAKELASVPDAFIECLGASGPDEGEVNERAKIADARAQAVANFLTNLGLERRVTLGGTLVSPTSAGPNAADYRVVVINAHSPSFIRRPDAAAQ